MTAQRLRVGDRELRDALADADRGELWGVLAAAEPRDLACQVAAIAVLDALESSVDLGGMPSDRASLVSVVRLARHLTEGDHDALDRLPVEAFGAPLAFAAPGLRSQIERAVLLVELGG
jgi:hypothetical protein